MSLQDQMVTAPPLSLADVRLKQLKTHQDHRGELTEIFRSEWHDSPLPVQWLACRSAANALRGIHVHAHHWSYLCAVDGEVLVGLHDVRLEKPTRRRSAMIHLDSRHLQTLAIPPGVAHGFYSHADSIILLGSSGYCAPSDYHRCRWDSPELSFTWPCTAPELSALDRDARGYAEMESALLAAMRLGQQACHLGWPGK